jgi:hypothetical protein
MAERDHHGEAEAIATFEDEIALRIRDCVFAIGPMH